MILIITEIFHGLWITQKYILQRKEKNWEYDFRNSEIASVDIKSKKIEILTKRDGPDYKPKVSPNGKLIAYIGYKDKIQTYQNEMINIMSLDGEIISTLSSNIDSSINEFYWDSKSNGLYISYDVRGDTDILFKSSKKNNKIADQMGGTTIGRPYGGGSFQFL